MIETASRRWRIFLPTPLLPTPNCCSPAPAVHGHLNIMTLNRCDYQGPLQASSTLKAQGAGHIVLQVLRPLSLSSHLEIECTRLQGFGA